MVCGPVILKCDCGEVIDVYPYEEISRICPECGKVMNESHIESDQLFSMEAAGWAFV